MGKDILITYLVFHLKITVYRFINNMLHYILTILIYTPSLAETEVLIFSKRLSQ